MANSSASQTNPAANAAVSQTLNVKGFTYVRDYAAITTSNGERVIIGDKSAYPISEMMQLKQAASIDVIEREPKTVNGTTYKRFSLQSINF